MRVLLVEDDADVRELISIVLEERGHEVAAFGEAESAWEVSRGEISPLMVVDWLLPGMSGLDLCRRVRQLPAGDIPVIVVATARHASGDLVAVLDAGADDYIAKPFSIDDLEVRITIAERQVEVREARRRAFEAIQEAARLQGVLLANSTIEHHLGNQLSLTMGYAEILADHPDMPEHLRSMAMQALQGVERATETLEKLRRVTHLERARMRGGPAVLDLDLSSSSSAQPRSA